MWARFPVVVAAVTALLGSGPILAEPEGFHPRLRFPTNEVRFLVNRAIAGAKQRLADPDCQQVFTDFQDASGNSLLANLSATGLSPGEYLDRMWFIDASLARPCQRGDPLVAYTSPG